jgi:rare lipoprotein A
MRTAPALALAFVFLLAPALAAEEGLASWYGIAYQGKKTSSGEIFDRLSFSAAHRDIPFGALVLVTNLSTGRRCVVRINDRGPQVPDRVIDLSEAAAASIGMLELGTAKVSLEPAAAGLAPGPVESVAPAADYDTEVRLAASAADNPPPPPRSAVEPAPDTSPRQGGGPLFGIQVASFAERGYAERCADRLRLSGLSPSLEKAGSYTRVLLKDLSGAELETARAKLSSLGYANLLVKKATKTP